MDFEPRILTVGNEVMWHPETRNFSGEISGFPGQKILPWYEIFNPKTGNTAKFVWEATVIDEENELLGWRYRNEEHNIVLNVFND